MGERAKYARRDEKAEYGDTEGPNEVIVQVFSACLSAAPSGPTGMKKWPCVREESHSLMSTIIISGLEQEKVGRMRLGRRKDTLERLAIYRGKAGLLKPD